MQSSEKRVILITGIAHAMIHRYIGEYFIPAFRPGSAACRDDSG